MSMCLPRGPGFPRLHGFEAGDFVRLNVPTITDKHEWGQSFAVIEHVAISDDPRDGYDDLDYLFVRVDDNRLATVYASEAERACGVATPAQFVLYRS